MDSGHSFSLDNFEGPLDLLLYLVVKQELDIFEVPLHEITDQFAKALAQMGGIDEGAETLSVASLLLVLKSRKLLPSDLEALQNGAEEEMLGLDVIRKLLEHCRFKQLAKELATKEEQERHFFLRGPSPLPKKRAKKGLTGVEVSLSELTALLQEMLSKLPKGLPPLKGEEWQVADKLEWLKKEGETKERLYFNELFHPQMQEAELLALFLALLELMKSQECVVLRDQEKVYVAWKH